MRADNAFRVLLKDLQLTKEELLANKDLLIAVLSYHVIGAKVTKKDLKELQVGAGRSTDAAAAATAATAAWLRGASGRAPRGSSIGWGAPVCFTACAPHLPRAILFLLQVVQTLLPGEAGELKITTEVCVEAGRKPRREREDVRWHTEGGVNRSVGAFGHTAAPRPASHHVCAPLHFPPARLYQPCIMGVRNAAPHADQSPLCRRRCRPGSISSAFGCTECAWRPPPAASPWSR